MGCRLWVAKNRGRDLKREGAGHVLSCLGVFQAEAEARKTLWSENRLGAVTKQEARVASVEWTEGRVAENEFGSPLWDRETLGHAERYKTLSHMQ